MWKCWYVANNDWGQNPQAVWDWMVQGYARTRVGIGGGGYGPPPTLQDWKQGADVILKVYNKKECYSGTCILVHKHVLFITQDPSTNHRILITSNLVCLIKQQGNLCKDMPRICLIIPDYRVPFGTLL